MPAKHQETSMTQSDSSSFTTWSKLKKQSSEDHIRLPSGNNNNSSNDASHLGLTEATYRSQSMPNLHKKKHKNVVAVNEFFKSQSNSSVRIFLVKLVFIFVSILKIFICWLSLNFYFCIDFVLFRIINLNLRLFKFDISKAIRTKLLICYV